MKTLGGVLFIRNGELYDYSYREAICCLQELCDEVVILDAGSDDGTKEVVKGYEDQKTMVVCLDKSEWERQQGREKLAYFQNLAKSFLSTDYYFLLQGDEIIHEKSFPYIRQAINEGWSSFFVTRKNLWKDCNHELNVSHDRLPCNDVIVRLSSVEYNSSGDGESIDSTRPSGKFLNDIVIWHYGFVRKKEVMKDKIFNMQEAVFKIPHDPKLDKMDVFDWSAWFGEGDLKLITDEHPKFIKEWIVGRP